MSDAIINRARAALDGVTPGPWRRRPKLPIITGPNSTDIGTFNNWNIPAAQNLRDAAFGAAARDLVPEMADALDALEAERDRLREALEALVSLNDDHGPFGGDLYRDRVDSAWGSARAALKETDT